MVTYRVERPSHDETLAEFHDLRDACDWFGSERRLDTLVAAGCVFGLYNDGGSRGTLHLGTLRDTLRKEYE